MTDNETSLNGLNDTSRTVPKGIYLQIEPTHWRWDKPHHPKRCVLCWVERIGVRLGILKIEDDR